MIIEGHSPRINEHMLCLLTKTGVTVRARDAIDHELAAMEGINKCVPVPGSASNVIIRKSRKLYFAEILCN